MAERDVVELERAVERVIQLARLAMQSYADLRTRNGHTDIQAITKDGAVRVGYDQSDIDAVEAVETWNLRPPSPEFARAVEMCARVIEEWLDKPSAMLQACGEMSAGERRTVRAALMSRARAIRALSPSPPVPDEVMEAARRIARAAAEFDAAQNSGDRWTASARLQEELNEDAHIVAVARALLHLLGEKATQEKETTT